MNNMAGLEHIRSNIRENCIAINNCFAEFENSTGRTLRMIDVGAEPGDCTGDSLDCAMAKIRQNLRIIYLYVFDCQMEGE